MVDQPTRRVREERGSYSQGLSKIEHEESAYIYTTWGNWGSEVKKNKERRELDVEDWWRIGGGFLFLLKAEKSTRDSGQSKWISSGPVGGSPRPLIFATSVSGARGIRFHWQCLTMVVIINMVVIEYCHVQSQSPGAPFSFTTAKNIFKP
jgi:hypothetical protein